MIFSRPNFLFSDTHIKCAISCSLSCTGFLSLFFAQPPYSLGTFHTLYRNFPPPKHFFLLNEYFWNNSKGNDLIMCREFLSFSIIFLLQVCMDHQRLWSNLEVLSDLSHKVMTRGREKEKRWNTFCNNIAFFYYRQQHATNSNPLNINLEEIRIK